MGKKSFRFILSVGIPLSFLMMISFSIVVFAQNLPAAIVPPTDTVADSEADAEIVVPSRGWEEEVSLEFRSTDAGDVLRYLAQKAELNISISNKVGGRVSILVNDVPIRDVFDIILRGNGLAYTKIGNVYNIMTEDEYKEFYGHKFSDLREVRTFRLEYALPEQAFNLLDTLKSDIGRLLIDDKSGTVMMMDTPDRLNEMEVALAVLESDENVQVIDLSYAKAIEVEEKLKDDLELNNLGTIKSDARTNQVIVRAFPGRLQEMLRIIKALDRKTREVLIDAKIVKVTMQDDKNTGVNWNAIFSNLDFHGVDTVGDFRPTTDATTPGQEVPNVTPISVAQKLGLSTDGPLGKEGLGSLLFSTISTDGYELFRFLQTIGETKIVSHPRLLVTENEDAKIHVGTREAYVTSTTTTGTSTASTAEEVEFIDVGIKFAVRPRINREGFVELVIKPEVSSVVGTVLTPSGSAIPIVDTSTAETKVLVKDGATVVIGGLRKNEKVNTDEEVPYLNKIPFFGNIFFKEHTKDNEIQELIIFITPHIVEGDKLVTGDEPQFGGALKSFRGYGDS